MTTVMADLVATLSDKCDRRDIQILKAIEALEQVRDSLTKSRKAIEKNASFGSAKER